MLIYGDAFVDYIAEDETNRSFHTYLGGATVNVAAGIARLGAPVAFVTVTGDDETSDFFRTEIEKEGVDLSYSIIKQAKRISGVFVHLTPEHDREFANYQDETPDIQVTSEDLDQSSFRNTSLLHICSGTMFHSTALKTTREAVRLTKEAGALVSLDANIRPLRWKTESICRETISSFLKDADLVKLTEEELTFLMDTETMEEGLDRLASFSIPMVLVTLGAEGTLVIHKEETFRVPTEKVNPIDTTGAGDAFMAGVLQQLHVNGYPQDSETWQEVVSFGNRMGAICVTKMGALSAMPYKDELNDT